MVFSAHFLDLVSKLGEEGLFKDPVKDFTLGSCLLRGYADLGVEQFIIVGERKLSSLFTGIQSTLPQEHDRFFTKIPSSSEIVNQILIRNFDIKTCSFKDQRVWSLLAEATDKSRMIEVQDPEIEAALAKVLLEILT
jgi:hypothetical protein